MKYRKKPVVIEAMEFKGPMVAISDLDYALKFDDWLSKDGQNAARYVGNEIHIHTLEGTMVANAGDFIIRGVKGELYPCKPDIFAATYERAE